MTVYRIFNRICERGNRSRGRLVVTPYSRSLGNCAEEMYYAVLKARRDGKRVRFLFPRPLFWKFRVEVANRALSKLESGYIVPGEGAGAKVAGWMLTVGFFCLKQLYLRPRAIWTKVRRWISPQAMPPRNNIFFVIPSIGRATLWQPEGVKHFSWDEVDSCRWAPQYEQPLGVRLRAEDIARGEAIREQLGLPLNAWYVCLHAREGGYHGDWRLSADRNCSIANYVPGIEAITDAGGYVVRLGDSSMAPLPKLEWVIDYAHSPHKSESMDVYLVAGCRFYIGMNSGPVDLAWLFDKPVVLTNLSEWIRTFPKRRGDVGIIKHVFSRARGRFLSVRELLNEPFASQAVREVGDDYLLVENTPEEIRDVILEHLGAPDGAPLSALQKAFDEGRRRQIHRWLDDPALAFSAHRLDDAIEKYRLAAHADVCRGVLGRHYLEQNWLHDATDTMPLLASAS